MTDIVTAVYELMGKFADPNLDHEGVREKVDRIFQVWIFFLSYYSFNLQSIITQYYGTRVEYFTKYSLAHILWHVRAYMPIDDSFVEPNRASMLRRLENRSATR